MHFVETPNSNIIDVIGIEQDELSARERPEQSMKHNPSGLPPQEIMMKLLKYSQNTGGASNPKNNTNVMLGLGGTHSVY